MRLLGVRMRLALVEYDGARDGFNRAKARLVRAAEWVTQLAWDAGDAIVIDRMREEMPDELVALPPQLIESYDSKVAQSACIDGEWWSHEPGEPFRIGRVPGLTPPALKAC